MSTATKPDQPGTAVERPRKTLDLESAKVNKQFLDAYSSGKLDALNAEQKAVFLFALGERLGVRPELGELMIFQGKPYITIDGRFRLAHASGLLVGVEPRPATPMERRNYDAAEGDVLWVCDVYRRGSPRPFRGWGHVSRTDRNPVSKTHPREMAKKRAKYDALRMAFPAAESIGPMHERFIVEAEEEIRQGRLPVAGLLATGEYTGEAEEAEAEVVGNDTAATTSRQREPGEEPDDDTPSSELPLNDKRPASRNAIAEGL